MRHSEVKIFVYTRLKSLDRKCYASLGRKSNIVVQKATRLGFTINNVF